MMDLKVVTSLLLVLLALAEAERYYHMPKNTKSAYPVKSRGESRMTFLTWVEIFFCFYDKNIHDNQVLRRHTEAPNLTEGYKQE